MPIFDFNDPVCWDTDKFWRTKVTNRIRANPPAGTTAADWAGVPMVYLNFHRWAIMEDNAYRAQRLPVGLNLSAGDRVLLIGDTYGWNAEELAKARPDVTFVSTDTVPLTQARGAEIETAEIQAKIAEAVIAAQAYADLTAQIAADNPNHEGKQIDVFGAAWKRDRINDPTVQANLLAILDDGQPRARRTVLDEDAASNGSRNRIRNELGGQPTHILTVGQLNFLFDQEVQALSSNLWAMNPSFVGHIVNQFDPQAVTGKAPENPPYMNWKYITADQPRVSYLDNAAGIEARSWKALLPSDWLIPHTSYNVHF